MSLCLCYYQIYSPFCPVTCPSSHLLLSHVAYSIQSARDISCWAVFSGKTAVRRVNEGNTVIGQTLVLEILRFLRERAGSVSSAWREQFCA
ncbi:hypothetical protein XELAEV_18013374mg [Xenopus laevis]|uniref:Uncharacterized protein n=1 Tax=Xenopus laevis TaxID=8355 RepID=A0A974HZJ8_XENLA|nr:hypothetical protein XELAEV_18013374mg [Xenopus laevis]